jgi:hypothetical protein
VQADDEIQKVDRIDIDLIAQIFRGIDRVEVDLRRNIANPTSTVHGLKSREINPLGF